MIVRHSLACACAFVSIWALSVASLSSSVVVAAAPDATSLTGFCGSSSSSCGSCHHHCCSCSSSSGGCHSSQRSSSCSSHHLERRHAISDPPKVSSVSLVPPPAPTPHPQPAARRSLQEVPLASSSSSLPQQQALGSPVIPISKTQLEQILGSLTDTTFQLDVLQENEGFKQQEQSQSQSQSQSLSQSLSRDPRMHWRMGRIPVRIHVQDLKVGGISLPKIGAESWNDKTGPINFGNIELWRG